MLWGFEFMRMEAKIRSVRWICSPSYSDSDLHRRRPWKLWPQKRIHPPPFVTATVAHVEYRAIISVIRRHGRCPCGTDAVTSGPWRDRRAYGMSMTRAGSGHRSSLRPNLLPSFRSSASRVRRIDRNILPNNDDHSDQHRVTMRGIASVPNLPEAESINQSIKQNANLYCASYHRFNTPSRQQ